MVSQATMRMQQTAVYMHMQQTAVYIGMRLLCFSFDQLCYSPMLHIMSDYALAIISRIFSNYALHLRSKALLLYASRRYINLQSEGCGDFSWSSIESTDRTELEPELESRLLDFRFRTPIMPVFPPLVPALCQLREPAYYAGNCAGIIASSLCTGPQLPNCQTQCHFSWLVVSPLRQKSTRSGNLVLAVILAFYAVKTASLSPPRPSRYLKFSSAHGRCTTGVLLVDVGARSPLAACTFK